MNVGKTILLIVGASTLILMSIWVSEKDKSTESNSLVISASQSEILKDSPTLVQSSLVTATTSFNTNIPNDVDALKIITLARGFPLYENVLSTRNDFQDKEYTNKEYFSAILSVYFNSLPDRIYSRSKAEFIYYVALAHPQLSNIKDVLGNLPQVRDLSKIEENISVISICPSYSYCEEGVELAPDVSMVSTILHEYAHYLDKTMMSVKGALNFNFRYPNSVGVIDTIDFYRISYNVNNEYLLGPMSPSWNPYLTLKNGVNVEDDFVSVYASGNNYTKDRVNFAPQEDFAESFVMYVVNGKEFRKLTEKSSILKTKYEWLKLNVFEGREYMTGSEQLPSVLPPATWGYSSRYFDFNVEYTLEN